MESELDKIISERRSGIDISAMTYDFDWLSRKVRAGEILIDPSQENIWSLDQQSSFIERLILNFPADPIHLEALAGPEHKYYVLENHLQLQTYMDFVWDKKFKLTKADIVPELGGKGYDDLSDAIKRRLRTKPQDLYIYRSAAFGLN